MKMSMKHVYRLFIPSPLCFLSFLFSPLASSLHYSSALRVRKRFVDSFHRWFFGKLLWYIPPWVPGSPAILYHPQFDGVSDYTAQTWGPSLDIKPYPHKSFQKSKQSWVDTWKRPIYRYEKKNCFLSTDIKCSGQGKQYAWPDNPKSVTY